MDPHGFVQFDICSDFRFCLRRIEDSPSDPHGSPPSRVSASKQYSGPASAPGLFSGQKQIDNDRCQPAGGQCASVSITTLELLNDRRRLTF